MVPKKARSDPHYNLHWIKNMDVKLILHRSTINLGCFFQLSKCSEWPKIVPNVQEQRPKRAKKLAVTDYDDDDDEDFEYWENILWDWSVCLFWGYLVAYPKHFIAKYFWPEFSPQYLNK
jgi:hypothetical protein